MDYKTIYIVDPIRGERIQMAKFLSEEVFTVMTFISPNDCFKRSELISCDLMVFVPRKEKNEIKHLMNIKKMLIYRINNFNININHQNHSIVELLLKNWIHL